MPPIPISKVIYKSSEDSKNVADNLIKGFKWRTDPQVYAEEASVIIQLEKAIKIKYIDIVYENIAILEIFVLNSNWKEEQLPVKLITSTELLTESECRTGIRKVGCKMFSEKENFLLEATHEKWDQIKFVLKQPYSRNKQMGFDMLRFVEISVPDKKITPPLVKVTSRPLNKSPNPSQVVFKLPVSLHDRSNILNSSIKQKVDSSKEAEKLKPPQKRKLDCNKSYLSPKLSKVKPNKPKNSLPSSVRHQFGTESSFFSRDEDQVKKLTQVIKTFLNDIDLKELDTSDVRVIDLRTKFHERYNFVLNEEGKTQFNKVIQNYLPMLYRYKFGKKIVLTNCNPTCEKVEKTSSSKVVNSTQTIILNDYEPRASTSAASSSRASTSAASSSRASTSAASSSRASTSAASSSRASTSICPICQNKFSNEVIELHAAECSDFTLSSESNNDDVQIISQTSDVIDCTENSCLSKAEQEYWKRYNSQPKAFHGRINKADYKGCLLKRCPICSLKYKESEIEEHSRDCAQKVYSGKTRMGLYLVDDNKKKNKKRKKYNGDRSRDDDDVIVID